MTTWILAYDVRDKRRGARLHRLLGNYACQVQYSIFLFTGSEASLDALLVHVDTVVDRQVDDVRCYRVLPGGRHVCRGPGMYPDGVYLGGIGHGMLLDGVADC